MDSLSDIRCPAVDGALVEPIRWSALGPDWRNVTASNRSICNNYMGFKQMTKPNIAREELRELAARRIRLEDERDALGDDIGEINQEAKNAGYSPRAFNAAVKRARMPADKREQADNLQMEIDLYCEIIVDGVE